MSKLEDVFVYGTLRPPTEGTDPDDSRFYSRIEALIHEQRPAFLVNARLFDMGTYPAACPGQGRIVGDLLKVDSKAMDVMDRLEGHPVFDRRERVVVQAAEESVEAWIYWAPPGLAQTGLPILNGDWLAREVAEAGLGAEEAGQAAVDPQLRQILRRFAESKNSWLSTVRRDGRPHSAPVWHIWLQGRVYVMTTSSTVKVANIQERPGVTITHPDPVDPIMIEGWALIAPAKHADLRPLFIDKYEWDIEGSPEYDRLIEITPTRLLAGGRYGRGRWSGGQLLQIRSLDL